jgi:hypothetical protein
MITVSLFGGLGNQMFQYAAGKALAERHGVALAIDLSGFRAHPERSFMLDRLRMPEALMEGDAATAPSEVTNHFFRARRRARVDRVMARVGLPKLRSSPENYREPHFHFDAAFDTLGPQTALFGYFQSERYFSSIAERIRGYFEPREPLAETSRAIAARIAASALPVSVHVRRGDYLQSGTADVHGLLDEEYYREALETIENRSGHSPDLFVFSDDQAAAARALNFASPAHITHVQGDAGRPWEDMALMARCRHHVIANSSFSWWGAWLNPSPGKIVVAPRSWFTEKGLLTRDTRDLCPLNWIRL